MHESSDHFFFSKNQRGSQKDYPLLSYDLVPKREIKSKRKFENKTNSLEYLFISEGVINEFKDTKLEQTLTVRIVLV